MAELAPPTDIEVPIDTPALDTRANPSRAEPAETPPEVEVTVAEPPPKPPRKIVTTDEGLETLKKQLAVEQHDKAEQQRLRLAAEARAASAEQTAASAQGRAQDSELVTVTTGLAHVKQVREGLRRSFADASAQGDHVKMAEIQDEMAEAAANQKMFERAEQELKNRPAPRPIITDPVEILAAKMAPQSAAWLRAHPDYAVGGKYEEMVAAHNMALARKFQPNTPPYFEFIERKLDLEPARADPGSVEVATHVDTTPQRATGGRTTAPAAAPVSRSGTGNGSRPRSYTLTPAQQDAAKISGLTNQEYAIQQMEVDELRKRGELN